MVRIGDEDKQKVREMFEEKLHGDAHLKFFGREDGCEFCDDTREMLEDVAGLSDRIHLDILDAENHSEEAARLGIERYPATVFVRDDGTDTGVRFYGIPSGYEFGTVIEDIIDIGNDSPGLSQETIEGLKAIDQDVTLSVFVTPT